ncbi:MAG: hypothetical protein ACQESU_08135, partial [Halobacteriota archaeon]
MQGIFYISAGEVQYYSVSDFLRTSEDTESTVYDDYDTRDATYYDDYSDYNSDDDLYGVGFLVLAFIFFVFFMRGIIKARKRKQSSKKLPTDRFGPAPSAKKTSNGKSGKTVDVAEKISDSGKASIVPPMDGGSKIPSSPLKESTSIVVKSAFYYRGAMLQYKVKVENHTSEPIGDIRIKLFVPDVFLLKEPEKTISMLESDEGKTVTFEVRPTGECGDCKISAGIDYYDYNTKKRSHVDLEGKMISVVCPVLYVREIDEASWRSLVTTLISAEESSKDLEIPAENLFDIATRVLKDMNMYMIEPETTSTTSLFTGVARFYAEGVSGLKYASYVEVVGKRRSRLIL